MGGKMPIEVSKTAEVTVTAKDFVNRAYAAEQFAAGLSEQGARWLAEVVTSFHMRQRR